MHNRPSDLQADFARNGRISSTKKLIKKVLKKYFIQLIQFIFQINLQLPMDRKRTKSERRKIEFSYLNYLLGFFFKFFESRLFEIEIALIVFYCVNIPMNDWSVGK